MENSNIDKTYDKLMEGSVLTDENIDDLVDVLEENLSDNNKLLRDLPSNGGDLNVLTEGEKEDTKTATTVKVLIDPSNGKVTPITNEKSEAQHKLDDLLEMDMDDIKTKVDISEESVNKSIGEMYPDLNATDISDFMKALDRYRSGEKFSYFSSLPESMKKTINLAIGTRASDYTKEMRNVFAQNLFEQVIQDNYINKSFVDLQNVTNEIFDEGMKDINKEFSNINVDRRNFMERGTLEAAIKIEDENPDKAAILRSISENFIQSYTLEKMYDMYNSTGKLKAKPIELEKFGRTCADFNMKYKNTKFIITDISTLLPTLLRHFDETYDVVDIKRFIIAFIKYTRNMKPSNVDEHVFMYYFIKHILNLDCYDKHNNDENLFYTHFMNTLNKFMNIIIDKQRGVL